MESPDSAQYNRGFASQTAGAAAPPCFGAALLRIALNAPEAAASCASILPPPALLTGTGLLLALLMTMPPHAAAAAADPWQLYQDQGTLAYSEGRTAEAETAFQKAIAEAKKAHPVDVRLADSLSGLAAVYREEHRHEESERLYKKALTIFEAPELGANRPDRAQCLEGLAQLLRQTERAEEASTLESSARTIWERLWADATYEGVIAEDQQDLGGAERAFRAALQYSEHFTPQYGRMLGTLENLVGLLDKQGRSAEAEPFCRDALSLCEKVFGPDQKKTTHCRALYARLQQKNHGGYPAADPPARRSAEPQGL